mmetsp:Transcript_62726/g.174773  ORF Transcript_62726/g.174773 Transcript_62726/m.174773 type:complete len:232 (+) Transcript_62726:1479-2174(+)
MAPWFPFTVIQQSLSSLTSLHAERNIWASSSLATPTSSTSSPGSTLPTVLLEAMAKPSVTEMPFLTTPRWRKIDLNSAKLIAPSLSASMHLKMAPTRASGKFTSSLAMFSGKPRTNLVKTASLNFFFSQQAFLNMLSSSRSFSFMCSPNAVASTLTLVSIKNSSPSFSVRGAQASVAFFTTSSNVATISVASINKRFARKRISCAPVAPFALSSPACASVTRFCSCFKVST